MKIYNETKITVVGKAEPTHSQDGRSMYYRVAVMQNGQATNLSVSEDIYNSIPDGLVEVIFSTVYDDTYKSFKADRLTTAKPHLPPTRRQNDGDQRISALIITLYPPLRGHVGAFPKKLDILGVAFRKCGLCGKSFSQSILR